MDNETRSENIDLFWNNIQSELCIIVPIFIKNILKAFEYTSASMVRLIDDAKITEIENFVKMDLESVVAFETPNFDKRDYYSTFYNNTDNFRFFAGQRDMLKRLSECINSKIEELGNIKDGVSYFHKKQLTKDLAKNKNTKNLRLLGDRQQTPNIENKENDVIEINKQSSLLLQKLKASLKNKKFSEDVSILLSQNIPFHSPIDLWLAGGRELILVLRPIIRWL